MSLTRQGQANCALYSTTIQPEYEPDAGLHDIPVVFHVIEHSNGMGKIPNALIIEQVRVLNEDFGAEPGTLGGKGIDSGIRFYLADTDPDGNPTNGITRTVNDDWFSDDYIEQYGEFLAWDPTRYLNVFTNDAAGNLGYVPGYPQQGIVGTPSDYVVLFWRVVGRPAPYGKPNELGRTLTHEVGHYFGLRHVFHNSCVQVATQTCYESGDLICDTSPSMVPHFGCPTSPMSCGTPDPSRNYMDYTSDPCKRRFSPEQVNRMRCSLEEWRSMLPRTRPACAAPAAAKPRNAGSNPHVLVAGDPWVGEDLDVLVLTTPGKFAKVLGFGAPDQRPLRGGQMLLVDINAPGGAVLNLPMLPGPYASARLGVPPNLGLCGTTLHVQAAIFGNGQPLVLTNAVDLTMGLR